MDTWGESLPENRIRSSAAKFLCGLAVLIAACAVFAVITARKEGEKVACRPLTAAGDPGLAASGGLPRGPDGQFLPVGFYGGRAVIPTVADAIILPNHEARATATLDGGRGLLYSLHVDGTDTPAIKISESPDPGTGIFHPVTTAPD